MRAPLLQQPLGRVTQRQRASGLTELALGLIGRAGIAQHLPQEQPRLGPRLGVGRLGRALQL